MRNFLLTLGLLCLLVAASFAQAPYRLSSSCTVVTSGNACTLTNPNGSTVDSFEELISGGPSTLTVTINGCMRGGTCELLDTNTSVANSVRHPNQPGVYDYFAITATWTGGSNVSVLTNATMSIAGGGGSGSGGLRPAGAIMYNPLVASSGQVQWDFPTSTNLVRLYCNTDTGTVGINLDTRTEAAPNAAGTSVLGSPLTCPGTVTIAAVSVPQHTPIALDVVSVTGSPTLLRVFFDYH